MPQTKVELLIMSHKVTAYEISINVKYVFKLWDLRGLPELQGQLVENNTR